MRVQQIPLLRRPAHANRFRRGLACLRTLRSQAFSRCPTRREPRNVDACGKSNGGIRLRKLHILGNWGVWEVVDTSLQRVKQIPGNKHFPGAVPFESVLVEKLPLQFFVF
jgi:hypothetical protein